MKRIFICLFLCTIFFFSLHSQSTYSQYKKEKGIILKSKIALELCSHYLRFHLDSLSVLGLDLLKENKIRPHSFSQGVCNRILGCYDVRSGSMKNGLRLLHASKSTFLNSGDEKLISEAYNEIGIAYLIMGDHSSAEMYFQTSLSHGIKSNHKSMAYMAEINLAKSALISGDLLKAKMLTEHYIRQALEDEKHESVANAYSFLGQIALDENQITRAKNCFKKQLDYATWSHSPFIKSRALNNQAIVYFMNNEFEKALHLFQSTLKQRKQQGFHFYTCESYMNLANFYFEKDDMSNGQLYIDSCIYLAENKNMLLSQIEALELLLEHDTKKEIKDKLNILKQKRKKLIKDNKIERRLYDSRKKTNTENRNNYIYIICFVLLGILWWLYPKD